VMPDCGWFVVVITASAAVSEWVRFELGWALRNHSNERILALIYDK
jgi:hypothetical protein